MINSRNKRNRILRSKRRREILIRLVDAMPDDVTEGGTCAALSAQAGWARFERIATDIAAVGGREQERVAWGHSNDSDVNTALGGNTPFHVLYGRREASNV